MHIQIDKEFQDLIPPLCPDELKQLEESLQREGVRGPLIVWGWRRDRWPQPEGDL